MKFINNIFTAKNISVLVPMILAVFFSCNNGNEILDSADTQNINSVLASSAFFNEGSDISANVLRGLTNAQYTGSRVEASVILNLGKFDSRLVCPRVMITRTGTVDAPAGTIVINYDTLVGCVDSAGVTRRGKIIITYSGKRWALGSTINIRYDNFYRNFTHIVGTLTDSVISNADTLRLQFVSKLVNDTLTFGDGKYITRTHLFTRTWYRSLFQANNEWHITGAAGGKNNYGKTYTDSTYKQPLVYRFACLKKVFIPVSGQDKIMIDNKTYMIDFGDGICDNSITVGGQKTIKVTQDGN